MATRAIAAVFLLFDLPLPRNKLLGTNAKAYYIHLEEAEGEGVCFWPFIVSVL